MTTSAGSSPRATASRLERDAGTAAEPYSPADGRSSAAHAARGAAPEGTAPRGAADPGRHRPDGRAQLRPGAPAGDPRPERCRRATGLVARERGAPARL